MRKRLKRARGYGEPLTPVECRRRSRAELETRVLVAVALGDGLTIARHPHMPRAATVKRWIAQDAAFAERYRQARADSRDILADDAWMLADQAWTNARTARERTAALRIRLDLIKWWRTTFGDNPGDEDDRAQEELVERLTEARARLEALGLANDDAMTDSSLSPPGRGQKRMRPP